MSTLRTDAILTMYSGSSTFSTSFKKGTSISEIAAYAQREHLRSIDASPDGHVWIMKRPTLFSERTGRVLRTEVPFCHAPVAPRTSMSKLSRRQREVYTRRHMTNEAIGAELGISPLTVEKHRQDLVYRLGDLYTA